VPLVSVAKLRRAVSIAGPSGPGIEHRIIDIHLVRGRGKLSAQHPHLPIEVHRTRVARGPRYAHDSGDGIGHWVIDKRVCSVGESASRDIGAATCVD